MYIEQLYTSCLAEAAYYIESEGEAVVIDPMREIEPYLSLSKSRNAKIKYVFETHFHADFVSGHLDLAKATGAEIVYGPTAKPNYRVLVAEDYQNFQFGKVKIQVLHTPGHTMESSCFLLLDESEKPYAVFTGDTLFVGEVGRPDLAVKSDMTKEDLAGFLFDSIETKIKTLPDDVIVFPGHGAGSSCGKNIGKERQTTIGIQKKVNYALQQNSKPEFVKALLDGLSAPPPYYFVDAVINKTGYENIDSVMQKNNHLITLAEFISEAENGALILDTRFEEDFAKQHIPDSMNISLSGQFANWVGHLIESKTPLVLVTETGKEEESVLRLARIGYENVKGILSGGMSTWINSGKQVSATHCITAQEFADHFPASENILDVRNMSEFQNGVVENSILLPLGNLQKNLSDLDPQKQYTVFCGGGYRSMMAISILEKNGFTKLTNVLGGMAKIKETGIKLVAFQNA